MRLADKIATMARRGAPLPYDSEVEYLESTGTQHIVIEKGLSVYDKFDCKFRVVAAVTYGYLFGVNHYSSGSVRFFGIRRLSSNSSWQDLNGALNAGYLVDEDVVFHWEIGNNGCRFNDQYYRVNSLTAEYWTNPYYIFATNNASNQGMELGPASFLSKHRLYYFQQRDKYDNLKLDLIPVKKDGVGCFYDRVSGQLFRNAGTGAFVIGPDKT